MSPREEHVWVQLSTRIPKTLHKALRLHCAYAETSLMDFVSKALEEHLARARGAQRKVRGKNA
jgi:predicted HicB family RNase H-like nuclease